MKAVLPNRKKFLRVRYEISNIFSDHCHKERVAEIGK